MSHKIYLKHFAFWFYAIISLPSCSNSYSILADTHTTNISGSKNLRVEHYQDVDGAKLYQVIVNDEHFGEVLISSDHVQAIPNHQFSWLVILDGDPNGDSPQLVNVFRVGRDSIVIPKEFTHLEKLSQSDYGTNGPIVFLEFDGEGFPVLASGGKRVTIRK